MLNLIQAANKAGIKYSSAKTILFAHRKSFKEELIKNKLAAVYIMIICRILFEQSVVVIKKRIRTIKIKSKQLPELVCEYGSNYTNLYLCVNKNL